MEQRKAITRAQLAKWPKATRAEKGAILDAVCASPVGTVTMPARRSGSRWPADSAADRLRRATGAGRGSTTTPPCRAAGPLLGGAGRSDGETAAAGAAGSDREPVPPRPSRRDDPAVIDQVLAMSAATIDRRLARPEPGWRPAPRSATPGPGSMLKSSIPMKTWQEWDRHRARVRADRPGRPRGRRQQRRVLLLSLDATDVATGWTEAVTVRSKGERIVAAGPGGTVAAVPVPHRRHPLRQRSASSSTTTWPAGATTRQITFTRGRSSHKNDQAHVEQKNWSVVRRQRRLLPLRHPPRTRPAQPAVAAGLAAGEPVPAPAEAARPRPAPAPSSARPTTPPPPHCSGCSTDHPDLVDPHDRHHLTDLLHGTDLLAVRHQIADIQGNLIELARRRGLVQPAPRPTPPTSAAENQPTHAGKNQMSQRIRSSAGILT